jgi:hypothetical protein
MIVCKKMAQFTDVTNDRMNKMGVKPGLELKITSYEYT